MTREQYEHRKRRLEEQLRAGIQLLELAYQAQTRALDLIWMLHVEEAAAGPAQEAPALVAPEPAPAPAPERQEPLPAQSPPRRRSLGDLEVDVRAALPRLPDHFTRGDVCAALGYEPDRGSLYRILQELAQDGTIHTESVGLGRNATVYRRTGAPDPPADG